MRELDQDIIVMGLMIILSIWVSAKAVYGVGI